jgi:hypothetical protein
MRGTISTPDFSSASASRSTIWRVSWLRAARGLGLPGDGFGGGKAGLGDAFGIGGGQRDHLGRLAFADQAHAVAFGLGLHAGLFGLLRGLAQRRLALVLAHDDRQFGLGDRGLLVGLGFGLAQGLFAFGRDALLFVGRHAFFGDLAFAQLLQHFLDLVVAALARGVPISTSCSSRL